MREVRELTHICYDITIEHLIEHYISLNYYMDTVVVIYNPYNYIDQLKDIGLYFDETRTIFDQVMVILVESVEDGIHIIDSLDPTIGPICSLWYQGNKISDNIEENLRKAN